MQIKPKNPLSGLSRDDLLSRIEDVECQIRWNEHLNERTEESLTRHIDQMIRHLEEKREEIIEAARTSGTRLPQLREQKDSLLKRLEEVEKRIEERKTGEPKKEHKKRLVRENKSLSERACLGLDPDTLAKLRATLTLEQLSKLGI